MTDKGMPDKIWIDETSEDCDGFVLGRYDQKYGNVDQCYIRKDLADELARDLEYARERLALGGFIIGQCDSLARYTAATEGK